MADIDIAKIQAQIRSFRTQNPEITKNLSDDKVVSIMLQQGKLSKKDISKLSGMLSGDLSNSLQFGDDIDFSEGVQIARNMQKIADENLFYENSISTKSFQDDLGKLKDLSPKELIRFVKSFKKDGWALNFFTLEVGDKEESIIELICDEVGEDAQVRKEACQKVFDALVAVAQKLGIKTDSYKEQFDLLLVKNFDYNELVAVEDLDDILNALVQVIENRQDYTQNDIENIINIDSEDAATQTIDILTSKLQGAYSSFGMRINKNGEFDNLDDNGNLYQGQVQQDGWAGNVAESIKEFFGSKNTVQWVKAKLLLAKKQIEELNFAKELGETAFKEKFLEIFEVEYDYANISAYKKVEQQYILASRNHEEEMSFNTEFKALLKDEPLREEVEQIVDYSSNFVTYYTKYTKEEVYEREFKNMSKRAGMLVLGQIFNQDGLKNVSLKKKLSVLKQLAIDNNISLNIKKEDEKEFKKAFELVAGKLGQNSIKQIYKNKGVENAPIDKKFDVLKGMAKQISQDLNKRTMDATGGKAFSEIQRAYDNSYKAAYGFENDIMKSVNDYIVSQQIGAGLIKTGAIIGTTVVATALTGGTGGAVALALVTSGATAAVEISDRMTNEVDDEKDLKNVSAAYEIGVDSLVAGVAAGYGGKAADVIWKSNASKMVKYLKTASADIGIGTATSAAGLLAKGQSLSDLTADEIFMNTLFAAAGGALNVATSRYVYTSLKGDVSFSTAKVADVDFWLRKKGILIGEPPQKYRHQFDIETIINEGKDLTPTQMEVLNKVANSNARFTTKELNKLINLTDMSQVDVRIRNASAFVPQKGKPPIIEENGTIQFNTNSPKEVRDYLVQKGCIKENEESSILNSKSKLPLTKGQIGILNEIINTESLNQYYGKNVCPGVIYLDTILELNDIELVKAIIKDKQNWGIVRNLDSECIELYKSMMNEKTNSGLKYKYGLSSSYVKFANKNKKLFDKIYDFRSFFGDVYIDIASIDTPTKMKRAERIIDFFLGTEYVASLKKPLIEKLINDFSDAEFEQKMFVFQEIENFYADNAKNDRSVGSLGADKFDVVFNGIDTDNVSIVKFLLNLFSFSDADELKEMTEAIRCLKAKAQISKNKEFVKFVNDLETNDSIILKLIESDFFESISCVSEVEKITKVLSAITDETFDVLPRLLDDDAVGWDYHLIYSSLCNINKTNKDAFIKILESPNHKKFGPEKINEIFEVITPENVAYLDELLKEERISSCIVGILSSLNKENKLLFDELLEDLEHGLLVYPREIVSLLYFSNVDRGMLDLLLKDFRAGNKIKSTSQIVTILHQLEFCPKLKPLITRFLEDKTISTENELYAILYEFKPENFDEALKRLDYLSKHSNITKTTDMLGFLSCSNEQYQMLLSLLETGKFPGGVLVEIAHFIDKLKMDYIVSALKNLENIEPKNLILTALKINEQTLGYVNKLKEVGLSEKEIVGLLSFGCVDVIDLNLISSLIEKFDGITSIDELQPHQQFELSNILLANNAAINLRGVTYPKFILDRISLMPRNCEEYANITKRINEKLSNVKPVEFKCSLSKVVQKIAQGISDEDTDKFLLMFSKSEINIDRKELDNLLSNAIKKHGNGDMQLILADVFISLAKTRKDIESKAYWIAKQFGLKPEDALCINALLKSKRAVDEYSKICANPKLDGEFKQTYRGHDLVSTHKEYQLALSAGRLINNEAFTLAQKLFLDELPQDIKASILVKRDELKAGSFTFPQTDFSTIPFAKIFNKEIKLDNESFVLTFVHAHDIDGFNAYYHSVDVQYAQSQPIEMAINNFNVISTDCNESVICASYLGETSLDEKCGMIGFLLNVDSDSQYVYVNNDIMSLAKQKDVLILEYMSKLNNELYSDKKGDYNNVSNQIKKALNIDSEKYIQFMDRLKSLSKGTHLTISHVKQACSELGISDLQYLDCIKELQQTFGHSEALVTDVKIGAVAIDKSLFKKIEYGKSLDDKLVQMLKYAHEHNLKVIVLD